MKKLELIKRMKTNDVNWSGERVKTLTAEINEIKDFMAKKTMPMTIRQSLYDSIREKEKDIKEISEMHARCSKTLESINNGTLSKMEQDVHFRSVIRECELALKLDLTTREFSKEEARQILDEFGGEN